MLFVMIVAMFCKLIVTSLKLVKKKPVKYGWLAKWLVLVTIFNLKHKKMIH